MEHDDETTTGHKRKRSTSTTTSRKGKEKVGKSFQNEEEESEMEYHSKQGYMVSPHSAKYNIVLAESSVEHLKEIPHAIATVSDDGKSVLLAQITFMAEKPIEQFYTEQKAIFVKFLRSVLPPAKQLYPDLLEKTPTNEFIAMVHEKIVPEFKKNGLDTVLLHVLAIAGASKDELGDKNYAGIKKFLETFCRLTIKIMPQEQ